MDRGRITKRNRVPIMKLALGIAFMLLTLMVTIPLALASVIGPVPPSSMTVTPSTDTTTGLASVSKATIIPDTANIAGVVNISTASVTPTNATTNGNPSLSTIFVAPTTATTTATVTGAIQPSLAEVIPLSQTVSPSVSIAAPVIGIVIITPGTQVAASASTIVVPTIGSVAVVPPVTQVSPINVPVGPTVGSIVVTPSVSQVLPTTVIVHDGEPSPTIPAAPSSLVATAISSSQINLSWQDNSDNEDGFKIERKIGAGGSYNVIDTVGANVTTYSDSGLSPDTIYYYRVSAYNVAGDSGYSNEAYATTQSAPLTPPSAPSSLVATAISSSQINLGWQDNSDNEDGFKIERKIGAGGTYSEIATVGAGVTMYSNTGLTSGTTYYYRVTAYNSVGDSPPSPEAGATTPTPTPAPTPTTPTPTSPAGGGGGGGCFIATAAYGTPMAEEIQVLRDFRDRYLITNLVGEKLVSTYYRVSPPLADYIVEHSSLKPLVRFALQPAIVFSGVAINTTPMEKIAIALVILTLLFVMRERKGQRKAT